MYWWNRENSGKGQVFFKKKITSHPVEEQKALREKK